MTTHPPDVHDLVRLPLGKGCVLVLTWSEYRRGIARGKAVGIGGSRHIAHLNTGGKTMTTALLDKIESAIDHARPKDARKLLSELRESLQTAPTPRPADQPAVEIDMPLGSGVTLRCPFPPRKATGYTVALSPARGVNGHSLAAAREQAERAWAQLLDQYRDWTEDRRY